MFALLTSRYKLLFGQFWAEDQASTLALNNVVDVLWFFKQVPLATFHKGQVMCLLLTT